MKRGCNTKKAILFGSYANGSADKNSDIDLLVDSNGTIVGMEFFGILHTLVESFNNDINLIEKRIISY